MEDSFTVLGIESSCDDTAAAIITVFHKKDQFLKAEINSSIVFNQAQIHNKFGGVVPELAARAHTEKLDFCVEAALTESSQTLNKINIISVTTGPGLIGGLLSGVTFAKSLSLALKKPLIGINHLVGHALTPRLTHSTEYPYLILIASGGHCQFLVVKGPSDFIRLGGTIDDAPGEAFDKTAKMLKLEYPGGPAVERHALTGNPHAFQLPLPLINQKNCNMSFSGLKTAFKREVDQIKYVSGMLTDKETKDLCASFQNAIVKIFIDKTKKAIKLYKDRYPDMPHKIAVAGGVAANKSIGLGLSKITKDLDFELIIPDPYLCTDNAAMIAFAGSELYLRNQVFSNTLVPRPRWPLDEKAAPMIGSGKKGRKA